MRANLARLLTTELVAAAILPNMDWRERISVDSEIHHGDACIRGTRVPVRMILASLSDGHQPAAILREYPQLTLADVQAALGYAAEVLQNDLLIPLAGGAAAGAGQG